MADRVILVDETDIAVQRMSRDIRRAAVTLSHQEARFLVDEYYAMQEDRIRADHRIRAMTESGEPHTVIEWLSGQSSVLEKQLRGALDKYSMAHPAGVWARSIKGIGPVIAAGLIANIDIRKAETVGDLWSYCGVAPGRDRRVKGKKSTYNPSLKRLTWIIGGQFQKLSADDEEAYYRQVYDIRKKFETEKSEAGDYAEQAAHILATKEFKDDTKAKAFYLAGKLPPGHINQRAARYAAKLFLAHLHQVMWECEGGLKAKPYPLPYAIAHLGHAHVIAPPR